jgi:hypothetical protein
MNTAPIFGSTFEEYNWVRKGCGYDVDCGMTQKVWENCDYQSQREMLDQYWAQIRKKAEVVSRDTSRSHYGEVW